LSKINGYLTQPNKGWTVGYLATGGYEQLTIADKKEKLKNDFNLFLNKRSRFFAKAASLLADGKHISASNIIDSPAFKS
jgi:hypothetical protein